MPESRRRDSVIPSQYSCGREEGDESFHAKQGASSSGRGRGWAWREGLGSVGCISGLAVSDVRQKHHAANITYWNKKSHI